MECAGIAPLPCDKAQREEEASGKPEDGWGKSREDSERDLRMAKETIERSCSVGMRERRSEAVSQTPRRKMDHLLLWLAGYEGF